MKLAVLIMFLIVYGLHNLYSKPPKVLVYLGVVLTFMLVYYLVVDGIDIIKEIVRWFKF